MADNKCTYRNPLVRDGESQALRLPEALNPDYVQVDERSLADLLRFVARYAEELEYYGPNNTPSGDWSDFFTGDVTTTIALLTVEDPAVYQNCVDTFEDKIFDDGTSDDDLRKVLKTLFDLIGTLALKIDSWYRKVPEGYKFREHLHRSITAELKDNLKRCKAYYSAAHPDENSDDKHLVNTEDSNSWGYCSIELVNFNEFKIADLDDVWQGSSDDIDDTIFEAGDPTIQNRIRAGFSFIKRIAESFINVIKKTQEKVPDFIEETMTEFSGHQPQIGLMLAFLKLFRHAQDHINTSTRRHLNFYFEDVLQLDRKEAVPDKVYLLIELAKHIDSHKLEAGTLFKAGKDAQGNGVVYKALREVVLNKAKVKALKSVYIDEQEKQQQVYEKPEANSKDGEGTELDDPSQGWKAFGESQADKKEPTMQASEIGFAISSPILLLAEGNRTIILDIEVEGSYDGNTNLTNLFKCYVTNPEGWSEKLKGKEELSEEVKNDFILEFEAQTKDPPITTWNPEVHNGKYQSQWPVLKLILKEDKYEKLKNINIEKIDINVNVEGVKDLVLQNELGVLDPTKPFMLFGPRPAIGSEFYVGSSEVFAKKMEELTINMKWHEWPSGDLGDHYNYTSNGMVDSSAGYSPNNSNFKADLEILKEGEWVVSDDEKKLFPDNFDDDNFDDEKGWKSQTVTFADNPDIELKSDPQLIPFEQYNVSLKRGFMRLVLIEPDHAFGHDLYPALLTKQVMKEKTTLPKEPYTPKIKAINLDYKATESFDLTNKNSGDNRNIDFFHVYPFGQQGLHSILGQDDTSFPLMPQFNHSSNEIKKWHEGEFYVGLSDVDPPQQISLLFKVAEGSADPTLSKVSLDWFCLTDEGWEMFDQQDVVHDSTNDLLTTGIIRFNIPSGATSESTLFPGNLTWIKAAVPEPENPDAVCRVIDVQAQAITAEFVDRNNDPNFLATVLEAGTISKLKTKQSEVKKIKQPYASEGGKMPEQDTEYHRRVSERLRHKERGVSIWDYERLVLEHFPSVYKAKCINHSTYEFSRNGKETTSEFAPGYVCLVVVPDLKNKNAVEPLKPRVSQNKQNEIKKFLEKRISPFLKGKLKVINALFEQVKVTFNVKMVDKVDEGFYLEKLEEDIKRFLSPWAYEEGKDISFGGSIHQSVILNFIEERDYVDYVTDFRMDHYKEDKIHEQDVAEITVTTARSVLVSHKSHDLNLL